MTRQVFIPSKGRASSITSHQFFQCIIVVEPQEQVEYSRLNRPLLVLPQSNQGIAYVRNFILESAIHSGIKKYWMFDDDIKKFTFKGKDCPAEQALTEAELQLAQVPKLGQGALEYGQFSWGAKKPLSLDGYCDVAVFMNVERLKTLRYRSQMNLKEDRDFTLQVLASGSHTARASQVGFVAPKNGSNAGGLQELYKATGREAEASRRMCEEWPGVCEPHLKADGRPDVKIHWKRAYNSRLKT